MKRFDVKSSTYIDFNKENNKGEPKHEVGDHVRIAKYKKIFAKGYTTYWSKEVFVIEVIVIIVPWTCVISNHNGEKILLTVGLIKKT